MVWLKQLLCSHKEAKNRLADKSCDWSFDALYCKRCGKYLGEKWSLSKEREKGTKKRRDF